MALLRQLALQRRQCLLDLRERGFLGQNINFRYGPDAYLDRGANGANRLQC